MEDKFDEVEFNQFLAEGQTARNAAMHLAETSNRLQSLLEEKGIAFDVTDPDAPVDLVMERHNNRVQLTSLAALIASVEAVNEMRGSSEPPIEDFKKRLQASFIAKGFSGPWLDIIDKELPGDALSESDTTLIAEEALDTIMKGEEAAEWFNNRYSQMRNFLENQGINEFTEEDELVLAQLTILSQSFGATDLRSRFEDARNVLIRSLHVELAWYNLVETFFTET